ncbi:MAG: PhzF family phenazine biosynthesis protein [Candidatus Adiutrix sp.]|jgi:predicted PhzF superfamily epimerase YddE/YHI9|nr:PhzF family phenazine biosynthesis protein [Candidatus Adiutrix sp.]
MIVKMFLINTFIDGLFSGGQALVAILRRRIQAHLLQALAWELKVPVTAYLLPYREGFAARYFAAAGEIHWGGYAALAAAKALYLTGLAPPDQPVRLEGLSGSALVRPSADQDGGVGLVLPSFPAASQPDWAQSLPDGLAQADVLDFLTVGPHRLICLAAPPKEDIHIPASSSATSETRFILSWPQGEAGYELRCFKIGGEEAALPLDLNFHSALAPFWGERLGRNRLDISHLAFRPALLRADLTASEVELSGKLQIVYKAVPILNELAEDETISNTF